MSDRYARTFLVLEEDLKRLIGEWRAADPVDTEGVRLGAIQRLGGVLDGYIAATRTVRGPHSSRPIPPGRRYRVMERDGFRCRRCGVQKNLTIDHVIPCSKGGGDQMKNLQTLCADCNSRKGDSL